MVTYYRYMRLYPGRRALFVTTSREPTNEVVLAMDFDKIQTIAADCSGIMTGLYTFHNGMIEANLVDAKRAGMSFTMAFEGKKNLLLVVGRTRRKLHWKLDWNDYFITNKGVKTDIPKDGLVQFFFSRVNSFRQ
jgi:hypothetical protein